MLPDYLRSDLSVVFCGTAAGRRSAEVGHYYAGRGNKFWRAIFEVGLTSELLGPELDARVLDHGIGLTDLAKGVAGMDRELPIGALCAERLRNVAKSWQPRVVAFNGMKAARVVLGAARVNSYGPYKVEGLPAIWVLPSTSGAANAYWSIEPWRQLASVVC
ncbi:mismatch-specific DNA-glycosylase [Defluviimonas sp. WL0075]|uniref:Mismatch-specific DNA-glycosylase n=1 Tax=Albidovulum sediminicola TaxID=2984331 RepID=A0ABT2Z0E0_9RHOB|nr:mismatch-specific DNA-glycosylase [Defluviimonas sp. WL0075]MCV2864545.1 mismatch-specific DNA-glycosylase [Defluviimonas sp. WL0075]